MTPGLYQIITPSASGSGFLVSEQGHIVTNAHVVGQHLTVTVRSISGALDNADVLGKDEALDLAVLLMEKPTPDLRPMVMGEASDIRPGDEVIALGFPLSSELGGDYTVTIGVVSSRRVQDSVELIQTDAAINPGSSGGPLANRNGEVIGVTTSKLSEYEGISFAISLSEFKDSLDALIAGDSDTPNSSDAGGLTRTAIVITNCWCIPAGRCLKSRTLSCSRRKTRGQRLAGRGPNRCSRPGRRRNLERFCREMARRLVRAGNAGVGELRPVFLQESAGRRRGVPAQLLRAGVRCRLPFHAHCPDSGIQHVPKALVFSARVCDFAPESVLEEVAAMDLRH